MKCGSASAVVTAVVACVAYSVLRGGQQQASEGEYELGSGKMFDSIAPRYDLINKVISLGLDMRWRRAMVEGLELRAGDRVVDMATGTADVAIMISGELAKLEEAASGDQGVARGKVYPGVVGIDPSARMLEVGREKAAEAGLSARVLLQTGDAQDLVDVADGSVDKLTMAFGIRNVPDRLKALKEFSRILAAPAPAEAELSEGAGAGGGEEGAGESSVPSCSCACSASSSASPSSSSSSSSSCSSPSSSSVLAILELQNPESGVLASASRTFIKYGAPVLGWVMSGNGAEYGHLKDSILNFPSVSEWKALMEEAGLEVFSHETMGFGTVHLYLARPRPVPR